jgi:2-keto-4-pentenoate hydratase/2-oxohepta-3-ene-1,7-dioic acid hydratase in catechol pathway
MKFVSYYRDGIHIGLLDKDHVWDLRAIYACHLLQSESNPFGQDTATAIVPNDMNLFIRMHHGNVARFADALATAKAVDGASWTGTLKHSLESVRLLSPVPAPSKIVCCGNSYARYLREWGLPEAEWPQDVKISFLKPPTSLIGATDTITFPPDSEQWDYENELAVVIGKVTTNITEEAADDHIFGYSILNDACVRDIPSWSGRYDSPRGKAGDTFAPFGPCVVPAAYLGNDPNRLAIKTTVDGDLRQEDRTSGLLWRVQRIVAFVSRYITLVPGDIVSTGSTSGNALVNGKWLKPGQSVRCEIEGIGVLENKVAKRVWATELAPLPSKH